MKQAVKSVAGAFGLDVTALHSPEHRLAGLQVRNIHVPLNTAGHAVRSLHDGREVFFFVDNPRDEIQGVHAKGRFYEPEELAIIRHGYQGGTFVDIGANVGNHTLYAALVLDAPRLVAFEPNPPAARVLRANVALNNLAERVSVRQVGLSSEPGWAEAIAATPDNLGGTHLETGSGSLVLERGDDALAGETVGFIKIDTEGMEIDVLRGLAETLKRDRPALFVEVDGDNEAAFRQLMASTSYRIAAAFQRYAGQTNYLMEPF
jgi:FkbM family methyltransferase